MDIWLSGGDYVGFDAFLKALTAPRILHIPLALDPQGERWSTCHSWFPDIIARADSSRHYEVQILKDPAAALAPYDAIVITGGNTYRLRHVLRMSGLDTALVSAIRSGIPLYGISAGATIIGADIDISVDKHPHYSDFDGLDLLQGDSVLCHYHDDRVDHMRNFMNAKGLPVLAIPDCTTVRFDGSRFCCMGLTPALRSARHSGVARDSAVKLCRS